MKRSTLGLLAGCAVAVLASAAMADPPERVGRISAVEGDVSFLPPGDDSWTYATRNFPVTEGESFWTGDSGRTELQVGGMDIRADSETELDVVALSYGATRLSLPQGSVDLRLWRLPRGGVSISTPAGEVLINQPGAYRLDVGAPQDDGSYPPVEVTVFEGDASAPGSEGFADVEAGAAALVYAGYDPEIVDAQDASIDDWARERESREHWDQQASFSPALTGYDDLADSGQFVETPDYGTVWFPANVPEDWAPYRYGHWAYVAPWGYTWIDDQSWGFAPFHYGRWTQVDGRWGWIPGERDQQPVYAPALVAFIGGEGASVGWIPLGPDEEYRPTYEVSLDYRQRVNRANVRRPVTDNGGPEGGADFARYRNARAAVVVRPETFAGGAPVQRATAPLSAAMLTQARPAASTALPPPTRRARAGGAMALGGSAAGARTGPPPPPPARLQAIRAAVAAQAPGSKRPPVIVGARITPPRPRPAGGGAFVAPAQIRNPAAQALQPVPAATNRPVRPMMNRPSGQMPALPAERLGRPVNPASPTSQRPMEPRPVAPPRDQSVMPRERFGPSGQPVPAVNPPLEQRRRSPPSDRNVAPPQTFARPIVPLRPVNPPLERGPVAPPPATAIRPEGRPIRPRPPINEVKKPNPDKPDLKPGEPQPQ